jgi:hypothetical protein
MRHTRHNLARRPTTGPDVERQNRVGGGLTPAALPHHRTCGSASGGSCLLNPQAERASFHSSCRLTGQCYIGVSRLRRLTTFLLKRPPNRDQAKCQKRPPKSGFTRYTVNQLWAPDPGHRSTLVDTQQAEGGAERVLLAADGGDLNGSHGFQLWGTERDRAAAPR